MLEQRERWALWVPVFIAAGVGFYFSLRVEPPLWIPPALLLILSFFVLPFRSRRAAVILWLPLFLAALGFAAASFHTWRIASPVLERKTYPLTVTGRVASVETLPGDARRVVLDKLSFDAADRLPQQRMPAAIRVKLKKDAQAPRAGDIIRLRAMLLPLSPPVMPGAYDFQRHAFFKGIGATGFAVGEAEIVTPAPRRLFFESLRHILRQRINAAIADRDAAAVTRALLYGEEQDISKETYEVFRKAGIAHLIAISGLQVTLVTGFFFLLVRGGLAAIPYAALHWPLKKITALVAMCAAVFYMMLIGSSISAERSVIMVCIAMLAIMLDRDPFTLRLAAFTAAAILLFQPDSLFGPSFQLSFAAVVALIAFYESTRDFWRGNGEDRGFLKRLWLYILASLATTLVATLATAPIGLYHFLRTPLFPGLVANLVAVPLSSFVTLPASIAAAFLMPLGLESAPLKLAEWSVLAIIKTAEIAGNWPHALYHVDAWGKAALTLIVLGGLWLCIWRGALRWLGFIPVVAALCVIPLSPRADILVSESGKLFAVRDASGTLWMSPGRAGKFVRDAWAEREGGTGVALWDAEGSPISCDARACLFVSAGRTVSFVWRYEALLEDCAAADIVISNLYIKPGLCPQPDFVVDRRALKHGGAHAFYFNGVSPPVRTVHAERGDRPWTGSWNDEDEDDED